jgi:hypothetical protein
LYPAIQALSAAASIDWNEGIALYEYSLKRLMKVYEQSDDSGGAIGDRIHEIVAGYRQCLQQQPPEGSERGKRLLELQRLDQWHFFGLREFWPLLGEAGQRAYAEAVEKEYAALPPPTAADRLQDREWVHEFPIVDRMERLAAIRGEIDLLIRVIARDLTSGHSYARIIEICRDAGRDREATQWAERGYRHHPKWPGMRVLLAEQYQRAGLDDEALALHGLLSALTALTTKLAPVTGESWRLCANDDEAQRTTRSYKRVAFWLAAIIVPFSLATTV